MRSHAKLRLNEGLARLARWLGFDRNPLRRGTDRVEGALRLVMIILAVLAVPAASVTAGRWADHYALHQAQVQRRSTTRSPPSCCAMPRRSEPPTRTRPCRPAWVPARWQPPGQPPRTGEVLAVVGARKGSTVRTWIDPSGAVTDPPLDHRVVAGDVVMAVTATLLLSGLLLMAAWALARRLLDRRRLRAWETEWRASGPQWSGHRS